MQRRSFVGGMAGSGLASLATWQALRHGAARTAQAMDGARAAQPLPEDGPLADGRRIVRGAATAFGTTVSIAAVHADAALARDAIARALRETQAIDASMSLHREDSPLSRLNRDGRLDAPDAHLRANLAFGLRLGAQTAGAFDVTVQPLWAAYAAARAQGRLPTAPELAAARRRIDWRSVKFDAHSVRIAPGAAITLNGLAQGYAADIACAILAQDGIADALIDTGEFGAAGRHVDRPWTLGLQHPRDRGQFIAAIRMDGRFVATSGDYATTFTDDFRQHHVLDPHSGKSPADFASVAVAAPTGLIADGLATALMLLDRDAGRALLAQYPGSDAVWIDKVMRVEATAGMPIDEA